MLNRGLNRRRLKVHVITMGCAKNVVDSEKLMAQLHFNDLELAGSVEDADVAVINTCGFIEAAKAESIDMIIENAKRKSNGKLKRVYAMGCLTERYMVDLQKDIPEVDRFFGSNRIEDVLKELGAKYKEELLGERMLTTPSHCAYLKISEGCDNPCSFCAIPIMRGRHVSRPLEDIVSETRLLANKGVKEIVVIGQDTTYYGLDLYGKRRLATLLERIADVQGIEWVRLMYAFPAKFPLDVLEVIANHPHLCRYIDIPMQHASDQVLKSMRRGISRRGLLALIETVRGKVPGIALRTTLIAGYPTETVKDVDELLHFVEEVKFDRLGVFTYSQEDGTGAHALGDTLTAEEKERRRALIMEVQQTISEEKNECLIGTVQKVIIDRREDELFVGRTEHDAPDIDNEVFVKTSDQLPLGSFCRVAIDDAVQYDLYGHVSLDSTDPPSIAVRRS